jgi:hypothetical protein
MADEAAPAAAAAKKLLQPHADHCTSDGNTSPGGGSSFNNKCNSGDNSDAISETTSTTSSSQSLPDKDVMVNTLKAVFEYYLGRDRRLAESRLSCPRFQRMALDADLIGGFLTSAKVDLIYHKVCKSSSTMSYNQFLDAIVRLAVTKYPDRNRSEAVRHLYHVHLGTFSGPEQTVYSCLDLPSLELIAAVRPSLQKLYEGYFGSYIKDAQLKRGSTAVLATQLLGKLQTTFGKVLQDFDVTPTLAPKAIIYAAFRDVAALPREVPVRVRKAILGAGGAAGAAFKPGLLFSYVHFAACLALLAQRVFDDDGPIAVNRLLAWMDNSQGRRAFADAHPGQLSAAKLKLVPDVVPEECKTWRENLTASSEGAPEQESFTTASTRRNSRKGSVVESLEARRAIHQVFEHYAVLGDPLNRSSLNSMKFNRFLRDIGALSSDVAAGVTPAVTSAKFAPPVRRGSVTSCASSRMMTRRPSTSSIQNDTKKRLSFSVSEKSVASLGIAVFAAPVIDQVDADMLFLQSVRIAEAASSDEGFGKQPCSQKIKKMEVDDFTRALAGLAEKCYPDVAASDKGQALADFAEKVLLPLLGLLGGDVPPEDIATARSFECDEDEVNLIEKCKPGLQKIFKLYAAGRKGSKFYWGLDSASRMTTDFGIAPEISRNAMQRMCRCATPEGDMSYNEFTFTIVLIALRIYADMLGGTIDKVLALLRRMNAVADNAVLSTRLGLRNEHLFNLPRSEIEKESNRAGQQQSHESLLWSAVMQQEEEHVGESQSRRSSVNMSWDAVMGGEVF